MFERSTHIHSLMNRLLIERVFNNESVITEWLGGIAELDIALGAPDGACDPS